MHRAADRAVELPVARPAAGYSGKL
jgi:hypothetical protein